MGCRHGALRQAPPFRTAHECAHTRTCTHDTHRHTQHTHMHTDTHIQHTHARTDTCACTRLVYTQHTRTDTHKRHTCTHVTHAHTDISTRHAHTTHAHTTRADTHAHNIDTGVHTQHTHVHTQRTHKRYTHTCRRQADTRFFSRCLTFLLRPLGFSVLVLALLSLMCPFRKLLPSWEAKGLGVTCCCLPQPVDDGAPREGSGPSLFSTCPQPPPGTGLVLQVT